MSWTGAGIPVIGIGASQVVLSGAQTIVLRPDARVVEHEVAGREGGIVETIGTPSTHVEIHGIFYERDADSSLVVMSGLIGDFRKISVPSFNSGYYFIQSGSAIIFDRLDYHYVAGHGAPYYHWMLEGVLSGVVVTISGLNGITYVRPDVVMAQLYVDYVRPDVVNAQLYGDYVRPDFVQAQLYGDYVRPDLGLVQIYGNYISNLSGDSRSGGNGY